ncbi:MAG: beta-ketoacyl-ACP synthase II [Chlamydiales bacterium]|nr:beta-ketoacyl-ACP synthase II [Chlamydiales bacterium]
MDRKRIVVTGMGVCSCFGNDVDVFYKQLLAGKSGVGPIDRFPCAEYPTRFAASIHNFDDEGYVDKKLRRRIDTYMAYAIVAGKKALQFGNIDAEQLEKFDKERCGVLIGSGMGGMSVYLDNIKVLFERGHSKLSPFFIPYTLTNMGGALLAMDLGFMGPNYCISSACATGNYAIIAAANHIRSGEADLMLCGGVEAPINVAGLAGFCSCKALSRRNDQPEGASRPWDRQRDGFVMGEGAGILLLESLEHARARGANILAEYLGGGYSCDAHHITELRPDGAGVALCMRNGLKDARVNAEDVNYINAHATSTPQGDVVEIEGIRKVFSDVSKLTLNATKSMIGHLLGGAGGVEAIVCVKAIMDGLLHPTLNQEDREVGLDLNIPTTATEKKVKVALSNSFGFGGHNAAVLFAPFNG